MAFEQEQRQALHLLQGITAIEMTTYIELGSSDSCVVEVLITGSLCPHLEDVVDGGISNEESAICFLDLSRILSKFTTSITTSNRRWRRDIEVSGT